MYYAIFFKFVLASHAVAGLVMFALFIIIVSVIDTAIMMVFLIRVGN